MKIDKLDFNAYQDNTGVYILAEPAQKMLFRIRIDLVEGYGLKRAEDIAALLSENIRKISLL